MITILFCLGFVFLGAEGRGPALGTFIGERGGDFLVGAEVSSPAFMKGVLSVKAGGETVWKEGRKASAEESWHPYPLVSLGLEVRGVENDYFSLYGMIGAAAVIPTVLTGSEWYFGGYGGFGFEFHFSAERNGSYYIEAGSTGTGARAPDLDGKPLLSNGLLLKAGFRWNFW